MKNNTKKYRKTDSLAYFLENVYPYDAPECRPSKETLDLAEKMVKENFYIPHNPLKYAGEYGDKRFRKFLELIYNGMDPYDALDKIEKKENLLPLDKQIADTAVQFNEIRVRYRDLLLKGCREILSRIKKVSIHEALSDELLQGILKYDIPKDYPAAFILEVYELNEESGKMEITGVDGFGNSGPYCFVEDSLSIAELEDIHCQLKAIESYIKDDGYIIGEDYELMES